MKYFHLTTPQQNIWNVQKYYEGTAISNLCGAVFYKEKRDSELLQRAIRLFIQSQSGIRLRFREGEEPMQYVSEEPCEEIPVLSFASREELDHYAEEFAKESIGLVNRQMYRFVVFQLEKESGVLAALSHLISDAWTFGLMANQVDTVYRNLAGERDIPLTEGDYLDWIQSEDQYFTSERYRKDKDYWESKYASCPEKSPIKLSTTITDAAEAKRITRTLPFLLEQKMSEYCRACSVTPAVLFETALILYLSKVNPENKSVTIGVPVLNRSNVKEKRIAGMFISTMPLTAELDGDMEISELARQLTKGHMDMFRHQKYPYGNILRTLRERQNFTGNLYDIMVSYQNARTDTEADTRWYSNGYSEVPFVLHIDNRDGKECHILNVDYQISVFPDEAEVDLLIERLEHILMQIAGEGVKRVRDISILPGRELEKVVYQFNDTYVEYPREKCIHELFMEQVARTPEKTALVFEDKKFTYKELDEMSNSLAHFLRAKGVKRGDAVPIIAKRSWHIIVAMLGVLKAGGAYMPVSPDYPKDRISYMTETAESRIALLYGYGEEINIESVKLDRFDFGYDSTEVMNISHSEDAAYIIFTSGSTGTPKGVTVCHRNVCNYADNNENNNVCHKIIQSSYESIVSVTNIVFDIFVTESLLPLLNGLCIYFANEAEATFQGKLSRLLEKNKIDVLQTTPTKMKSFLLDKSDTKYLQQLKAIILGGEAFPKDLYHELKRYTDAKIYNIYGPTETTVWSSNAEVIDDNITIGKPIANTQIYILDKDNTPLPIGIPGELCIAGDGVGKGYLNRSELTAERFVPNPFATEKSRHGKVMYRTGDLARWRADGEIEYLGRIDTQVKIRGLRIELGEIESVMNSIEGIGLAAVTEKRDADKRQYLAGYYVAETEIEESTIRERLSAKLPKYMVPNYFMRLEAMPMTSSGKIDRKNLPVPELTAHAAEYIPPETDTERRLAGIWQRLLRVEKAGKTDDFFELGGDSLLAISMLNEIEKEFHMEISVREVIGQSTLAGLARCVEQAHASEAILAHHEERYVLLPQQKAIYAACRKEPDTLAYNMPARIPLPETIDRDRLKKSILQALNRHELLKSHIQAAEDEFYGVYEKDARIAFEEYAGGEEAAFVRPFDLGKAPLIRIGFTEDALLFDMHHIVADGFSLSILLRDIMAVYKGDVLQEPRIAYSDYASYYYGLDTSAHRNYFKEMLKCEQEAVVLPETRRPGKGGESKCYHLPKEIFAGAKKYAKKNGMTDTMVFLGAYGILLSKYTGKREILSSIILQNRVHADTRDVVGMFVNTLPVYFDLKESVAEYMEEVKELVGNLFRYQELPFGEIADAAGISDKSVINASFVYQGDGEKKLELDGLELVPEPIDTHTAKFDLSMELTPAEDGCKIRLEYNLEKYDEKLMDALADSYLRILGQMEKEKLADISVLSEEEYRKIVEGFNDTYVEYPKEKCVHELFLEQAAQMPEKTALIFEDRKFTYRQLDEMSNSLAHFLREKGIGRNDVVPIIAKRSWHVIVAMLGVLKAGGAYMPVDTEYPEDRIAYMIENAGSRIALSYGYGKKPGVETVELGDFDFGYHTGKIENISNPEDLAYIIFTSGSTGTPKGVMVCHRNVCNYANCNENNSVCYRIIQSQCKSIVSVTNTVFDIFVTESLLPLLNGLCIYFANEKEAVSQGRLRQLFEKSEIDVLQATPTKMRSFLLDKSDTRYLRQLKAIVLGGEAFPKDLYHELRSDTDAKIYNIYGPAETTVWSSNAEVTNDHITIGKPIANTQIYILDRDCMPLPIGVPGELCIAGDGVGKGYLNRPELTAERFVPNPFATEENRHGKVMYRTGDLARWNEDGEIEYLGRIDTQVKIRGLRIELGEIESVMAGMPGIGLAAVAAKRDETGRQYLVGYYTADRSIDERLLRGFLSAKLPKYMVPNYFLRLDSMPMTPSGKIDRKNLPVSEPAMRTAEFVSPETDTERRLAGIWQRLLQTEGVGRTDDFFELGGDSLLAISMLNEIEQEFHVEISVREVMGQSTLAELARCVEQAHGFSGIPICHEGKYVLLPQQKAIYAAYRKEPDTLAYNMSAKINLPKSIDRKKLKRSIVRVLDCHKLLKSHIQTEEDEIYGVYEEDAPILFEEWERGKEEAFVRPFNLEKAPLVRIGFTEDSLLFDMHHIVADGDSVNTLLRDIVDVYAGKTLREPKIAYSDYAAYFYGLDMREHRAYFKEMLKCDLEPTLLPQTEKPQKGGRVKIYQIPSAVFSRAKEYGKRNGMTDTMVFLGAYGILLFGYTGKRDVLSSIILQNRLHPDTRNVVGMFVNTLPVHFGRKESTAEYMQGIKRLLLDLFRYQELPFWEIADAVGMKDKSVVNTSFVYQGDGEKRHKLDGQRLMPELIDTHTAKFDLSMELTPVGEGCRMRLEYDTMKYDGQLMDALADAYIRILGQLDREKLADISVLSEEEHRKVVEEFNDTCVEYPREKCIHELFMEQAARIPGKTALVFEDSRFTYRQLDEMSNSLAHFLREKGVKRGDAVPIIAKRSWHVIVAMLGVLKAGGAYMPVAPDYPEDRIASMLETARSRIALLYGYGSRLCTEISIETVDLADFDFGYDISGIGNVNCPEDMAYVIFTSGSTGEPKGVTVCHRNVCNYADNNENNSVCHKIIQSSCESIISVTNIVFDIFVTESLLPLLNGLCIYFANETEATSQGRLARLLERNRIDVLQTTPTKMRSFLLDKSDTGYLRQLKAIILGGEAFPKDLYHELKGYTDAKIYNIYGPAETTVWSSNAEVTEDDITIGRPIANTQIYILDRANTPLPIGVPGELCIAGDGVGKGYLNRPELTAERFVPNPFATEENRHGKVMYRTGDLARWRADGKIEYLGRIDTQVKIRGLRIELGEIESVMAGMEGVGLAAVADKRDESGRQYLVGYYTVDAGIDERKLRAFLSAKLPKYMIPNFFMRLDSMPMTPSGKTDRKNLPVPGFAWKAAEYVPPVSERERKLCRLLEELLHMEQVGLADDFFELGGDSLTAIEYVAKAQSVGIDFSLQNVFDYPTVGRLCGFLEKGVTEKVRYEASDFERYQGILAESVIDETFVLEKKPLGNILLTGATGFLGAHVLDRLMEEETGKVYCLVRDGKEADGNERLREILRYYFGDKYEAEFAAGFGEKEESARHPAQRIIPVSGDIVRKGLGKHMPKDVQTVIHTAATVKHYGSYDYFHQVNVEGTRNVIEYAKSLGAKLIHVSTLSVSGNSLADDFTVYRSQEEKHFYETSLYIGQPLDNVYIHSKFEAERAVYDGILGGLEAAVIRVGNLTNRASDFRFQPNYRENAFLTRVKAILELGLFPDYLRRLYSEFSPVDLTAEGIVRIAQYADRQSVFHLYSNRPIYFDRLLEIVHGLGIRMEVVNGEVFHKALRRTLQDSGREYIYEAFQNDMDAQGRLLYDSNIRIGNDFTVWFLKKLGFEWNEIDMEYIRGYVEYFRGIGYLKPVWLLN